MEGGVEILFGEPLPHPGACDRPPIFPPTRCSGAQEESETVIVAELALVSNADSACKSPSGSSAFHLIEGLQ